jgi:hypothetical protein
MKRLNTAPVAILAVLLVGSVLVQTGRDRG